MRFRIGPEFTIAIGMTVLSPEHDLLGVPIELIASRHPRAGDIDAYERVLGEAMLGDATLFAREDYVEEAWRIVDPALAAETPVYEYDAGTWGPPEIQDLAPPGGWHDPVVAEPVSNHSNSDEH